MTEAMDVTGTIFSIGHSNHPIDTFISLLRRHRIEVVVDTRSAPYSRHAPHFNRPDLKAALQAHGIRYSPLGKELGGRPAGREFYDEEGHVLYNRLAESLLFRAGIRRLERSRHKYRIAIMCSEENPAGCHRKLLIARVLASQGVTVKHIRGDGSIEDEAPLVGEGGEGEDRQLQLSFLDRTQEEVPAWRSIRSVSPRRPPASSSEH